MEFECDFDGADFCQYSSFGWGFQKSLEIAFLGSRQNSQLNNNLRQNLNNYFPCTYNGLKQISKLVKKIPNNLSQPLCLRMAYLLEEKGEIKITDQKAKWSSSASKHVNKWNYITFPISVPKPNELTVVDSELEISGKSICVDNFTVTNEHCSLINLPDKRFPIGPNLLLTQPFNVLLAILTLIVVLIFLGVTMSIVCAKKSQRTLQKTKQMSRRSKSLRLDRYSLQNSMNNDPTINSNFNIDTFGSSMPFSSQNRFLPNVVHVRNNPQLFCYTRHHSFLASKSVESSETTPNCRFSLALTEDAQVQLLTNSNLNSASPPVSSDLSARNFPMVRQHSFTTTISHERTPSPTCSYPRIENNNQQRPQSISIVPTFCAPILDQSESDLSLESVHLRQAPQSNARLDRSRPICESMNIGYVSDNSPCDLPHYDAALELLAAHKMKLAQSIISNDQSDVANNNNNNSNNNNSTNELSPFDVTD